MYVEWDVHHNLLFSYLLELLLWIFVKSQLIAHLIVSVLILEFGSLIYLPVLTTILCGLGLSVLYASSVILCGFVLQSYMPQSVDCICDSLCLDSLVVSLIYLSVLTIIVYGLGPAVLHASSVICKVVWLF